MLFPAALFFLNSASCFDISALRSKKEVALTPLALALAEWDIEAEKEAVGPVICACCARTCPSPLGSLLPCFLVFFVFELSVFSFGYCGHVV